MSYLDKTFCGLPESVTLAAGAWQLSGDTLIPYNEDALTLKSEEAK